MKTLSYQRRRPSRRLTLEEKRVRWQESLESGTRYEPNGNDIPCITEFAARGIPESEVETFGPHQNVRTFNAWKALGRYVRKGEKSVKLCVWRTIESDGIDPATGKRKPNRKIPATACVFHVSQTEPMESAIESDNRSFSPSSIVCECDIWGQINCPRHGKAAVARQVESAGVA